MYMVLYRFLYISKDENEDDSACVMYGRFFLQFLYVSAFCHFPAPLSGVVSRAFQFGQKSFDSIRFDSRYRIDFFRFDSIRQSDKFAASTLIFK